MSLNEGGARLEKSWVDYYRALTGVCLSIIIGGGGYYLKHSSDTGDQTAKEVHDQGVALAQQGVALAAIQPQITDLKTQVQTNVGRLNNQAIHIGNIDTRVTILETKALSKR